MSINKTFTDSIIKIMTKDESKVKMVFFLNDGTFPFMYDVNTTIPSQFPDPGLFYVNNFQTNTSVAVEIQIYSRNFKSKKLDKYTRGY